MIGKKPFLNQFVGGEARRAEAAPSPLPVPGDASLVLAVRKACKNQPVPVGLESSIRELIARDAERVTQTPVERFSR
jgi:hypothetical protein